VRKSRYIFSLPQLLFIGNCLFLITAVMFRNLKISCNSPVTPGIILHTKP